MNRDARNDNAPQAAGSRSGLQLATRHLVDDDFADLHDRGQVGVVGDVGEDFLLLSARPA